jgi:uncharacterized protein (DUF488 family)
MKAFTIGFTKKNAHQFFSLIKEHEIERILDIRLNNISQLAGFTKRDDLRYFLKKICGVEYLHLPELAPTKEILDAYKKTKEDWSVYESKFHSLMVQRKIEKKVSREIVDGSCFLCSESTPEQCHRRLVVEYLQSCWGDFEVNHL